MAWPNLPPTGCHEPAARPWCSGAPADAPVADAREAARGQDAARRRTGGQPGTELPRVSGEGRPTAPTRARPPSQACSATRIRHEQNDDRCPPSVVRDWRASGTRRPRWNAVTARITKRRERNDRRAPRSITANDSQPLPRADASSPYHGRNSATSSTSPETPATHLARAQPSQIHAAEAYRRGAWRRSRRRGRCARRQRCSRAASRCHRPHAAGHRRDRPAPSPRRPRSPRRRPGRRRCG